MSNMRMVALSLSAVGLSLSYAGSAGAQACGPDGGVLSEVARYTIVPQFFPDAVSAGFFPGAATCPGLPGYGGIVYFSPACGTHDDCYSTLGTTRASCDSAFGVELRGRCEAHYNAPLWLWAIDPGLATSATACSNWCKGAANLMEDAVEEFGAAAYSRAQSTAYFNAHLPWLVALL